jgi:hypothetical protein
MALLKSVTGIWKRARILPRAFALNKTLNAQTIGIGRLKIPKMIWQTTEQRKPLMVHQ